MTALRPNVTRSLDGLVAGPGQSPLGIGGLRPDEWLLPLKAFREMPGEQGGEVTAGTPIVEGRPDTLGATVRGGNMFAGGPGPWGAEPWNCRRGYQRPWRRRPDACRRTDFSGSRSQMLSERE
jgi:hypothetical protein